METEEYPLPEPLTFQSSLGGESFQFFMIPVSEEIPVRSGPRHCGQSFASRTEAVKLRERKTVTFFMGSCEQIPLILAIKIRVVIWVERQNRAFLLLTRIRQLNG